MLNNSTWTSRRGGGQSWRGRGKAETPKWGNWYGNKRYNKQAEPDISKLPRGGLLHTVSSSDLVESNPIPNATISGCEYVASYNWLDNPEPTIVVPGKPPLWRMLKEPQQLKEDEGDFFRDPNAARFPSYPTEPAVKAIYRVNPAFPASTINIFACGSTLGNLLRFVREVDKPFRFNVERVGNTVFFVRKENSPRELITGIHGYGHTFPEAYTTWEADVAGSETHQRLIQYTFGGLKCLVRFECDGYINTSAPVNSPQGSTSNATASDDDDLVTALAALSGPSSSGLSDGPLNIMTGGAAVPQSSIFDLKTRSGRYGQTIDMDNFLPLLFLKQIPNFVVAYHDGAGRFEPANIQVRSVESEVEEWENENKEALERLAVLLHKIIEIAKTDERGLLEVYRSRFDHLEIRQQYGEGTHALPEALREAWSLSVCPDQALETATDPGDEETGPDYQGLPSDDESDDEFKDFTACSADSCGYCGRCSY